MCRLREEKLIWLQIYWQAITVRKQIDKEDGPAQGDHGRFFA
jgi:hypothetical protein